MLVLGPRVLLSGPTVADLRPLGPGWSGLSLGDPWPGGREIRGARVRWQEVQGSFTAATAQELMLESDIP